MTILDCRTSSIHNLFNIYFASCFVLCFWYCKWRWLDVDDDAEVDCTLDSVWQVFGDAAIRSPGPHLSYPPRKPPVTHRQCDFRRAADFVVILFIELVVVFCVLFFANISVAGHNWKCLLRKWFVFGHRWRSPQVHSAFRVPPPVDSRFANKIC